MSPPPTTPAAVQRQLDTLTPDTARLSALVDESPEAVAVLDAQWRYVYVNRACLRLMSDTNQHPVGRILWELSPQLLGTSFEDELRAVMSRRTATRRA